MLVLSRFSPFYAVQDTIPGNSDAHHGSESLYFNYTKLDHPLQIRPEIFLVSSSRASQVGNNINHQSQLLSQDSLAPTFYSSFF